MVEHDESERCPDTGQVDCGCGSLWHYDGDFEAWLHAQAEWSDFGDGRDELEEIILNTCTDANGEDWEVQLSKDILAWVRERYVRRPRVIETAAQLREAISAAFQNGVNLTVLSQNWRPWVIWEDDDGHAHASSVPVEDDPERFTLADVKLPVTVLWEGGES